MIINFLILIIKYLQLFILLQKFINKNISEILDYIKLLYEEDISKFVNYSKKYSSNIELDNNYEKNNFEEIYEIVHDASLLFNMDN